MDKSQRAWRCMLRGTMHAGGHLRRFFHKHDLTGAQYRVLHLLCEHHPDGLKLSEVGHKLHVTCGNITSLVDQLEQRGFVRRESLPSDRRVMLALATEDGHTAYDALRPVYRAKVHQIMSCLSGEEQETLIGLLEKVLEHASSIPEDEEAT